MSLNKVQLIGHLGKDVEVKAVSETLVAKFSVATNEKTKTEDRTEWHNVVAWGKLADICGKHLSKGSHVYIEGRLQTRSWDKDGQKKYTTEVVASNVQFLGSKQDEKRLPNLAPKADLSEELPF